MNLDNISDISVYPSTYFLAALNREQDTKLKGLTFETIQATMRIKHDGIKAAMNMVSPVERLDEIAVELANQAVTEVEMIQQMLGKFQAKNYY